MRHLDNLFGALAMLFLVGLGAAAGLMYGRISWDKVEISRLANLYQAPTDAQVNQAVARLLKQGRASELYAFYAEDAGSAASAAYYTIGAIQGRWSVSKAMALVWFTRMRAPKGRSDPADLEVAGGLPAASDETPMSLAEYVKAEKDAALAVNERMNTPMRPDWLAAVLLHEQEMNRRFVVRFGDAIDWGAR